ASLFCPPPLGSSSSCLLSSRQSPRRARSLAPSPRGPGLLLRPRSPTRHSPPSPLAPCASCPQSLIPRQHSGGSGVGVSVSEAPILKSLICPWQMLSPTYKQRNEDFRRIFKGLPEAERLLVDYSCALQRDILLQGRLYLSENWICFYSNIFRWETTVSLKDVKCLKKEKTAKLIPNAIQIFLSGLLLHHFFTSFGARDRCFLLIFRLWQNALLEKTLSPRELWLIVHQCYGSELGLTSEDDDYVSPIDEINDENTDSQVDASSSHTVTSAAEPPQDDLSHGTPISPLEGEPLPSEELPTDMSNSSSSTQDEGEGGPRHAPSIRPPPSHGLGSNPGEVLRTHPPFRFSPPAEVDAFFSDLPGRLLINAVYHVGAEKLQQMLFSDSQFIHGFLDQRKFTGKGDAHNNKCHQSRVISYTIPINNPLGPKVASVVETQTLFRASSKSGGCVVDSEVITQGIPYQDYFYTAHRYCITALAKSKARLRVSSEIRYRKQPWNLVKALIEKNAWSGVEDYFQHLELALGQAEKALLEESCHSKEPRGLLSGLRRRKRTLSWRAPHAEPPIPTLADGEGSTRTLRGTNPNGCLTFQTLSASLSSLVVLVILNMMLFYRLWSLEHTARTFESWQAYALSNGRKLPQTASEWAEILELQKRFHSVEVQKWKQILKASVELLDEVIPAVRGSCKGHLPK
uniref:GRAM domain containing 1A n=1 Tax=Varanus komodoensis TaxID=61221 RepID=A0A8D2IXH5_VARKO